MELVVIFSFTQFQTLETGPRSPHCPLPIEFAHARPTDAVITEVRSTPSSRRTPSEKKMIAGATIAVLGATALLQRANALSAKSSDWIDLTTGLDVPGLRNRWIALCERLHLTKEVTATRWQEIETRHSEPQRQYHTLTHLSELFNYLDSNFGTPVQRLVSFK